MTKQPAMPPIYGYSHRHDAALALCIAEYGPCAFGCAKDGAPNCEWNVARNLCGPAAATMHGWSVPRVPQAQMELPL